MNEDAFIKRSAKGIVFREILRPSKYILVLLGNAGVAVLAYWAKINGLTQGTEGYFIAGFFAGAALYSVFLHVYNQLLNVAMAAHRALRKEMEAEA